MSAAGTVPLKEIWAMLDRCAPGHRRKEREHNWIVFYKDRTFPRLPRGGHGEKNPSIQVGHVKQMVRHLGIEECARQAIERLR